jgi:hypothetical protein
MTRRQLEHIIRAAAASADVRDVIIIGSQAILGPFPDAPAELTRSIEADVFPQVFVEAMVRRNLASPQVIRSRLGQTPRLPSERRQVAEARLDEWNS